MKKKVLANIIMVAIILVIAAAGILGVGYIQGWFDADDGAQAVLCDMRGVLRLERSGVSYTVEGEMVLREGDKITCDSGATTGIRLGNSTLTLGEKAVLIVSEPAADKFAAEVTGGEVFANCEETGAMLSFAGKEVALSNSTVFLSVRTGSQSVSVLRGSVADAAAGQVLNYIADELSVSPLDVNTLNDFAITQARSVLHSYTLCVTEEDLDRLEADRQMAMQEMIDKQTDPSAPSTDASGSAANTESSSGTGNADTQTQATNPSGSGSSADKTGTGTGNSAQSTTPTKPEQTDPTGTGTPPSQTSPDETTSQETTPPATYTCTITIRCDTILNNMSELNPGKAGYVPGNGVILSTVSVKFAEGESAFDVLKRVCAASGIQLEYSWQAMFDTYYIEGINNLYEKDCGSESGWMYKVNGWFPNYGVSNYTLQDGDAIAFLYSCKGYGTDVGAPEWEG